jgi:hypothetical protein
LPTIRCDVLVLGSTLGGLVAANYIARAGLRVVLLEEDTHAKRPALLREPFLLSGLESGGSIMRVLRELALPLIEQREIERMPIGLQVILPNARVDVPRGVGSLARELEAHGLADAKKVRAWLEAIDVQGMKARAQLWDTPAAARKRPAAQRLLHRAGADVPVEIEFPGPPAGLEEFIRALLEPLCAFEPATSGPARALLLHGTREGSFQMPHSGETFLGLFRRRLPTLHGEIRAVPGFGLVLQRSDVGVALARETLLARALVIAVPREPLREFLAESTGPLPWLEPSAPALESPLRLFRSARKALPVGMAARLIRADAESPAQIHWLARTRDAEDPETEWIVAGGPGASQLSATDPLGSIAPFTGSSIVPVDPGPTPRWDRDAADMHFQAPETPAGIRQRPPIVTVGPELAPALGFEGEVLCARRVALHLCERLGPRRRMP